MEFEFRSGAAVFANLPATQQNLPCLLDHQAQKYGDKRFLRIGDISRTYTEMRLAAASTAGALRVAGVKPGDRVAIMSGNRMELYDYFLGCAWLGAIFVPLNTAWRGAQLDHAIRNSAPRVLVAEPQYLPILEKVARPDELESVWSLGSQDNGAPSSLGAVTAPEPGEALPLREIAPGTPTAIMYTSGTTGPSKGVICPAAQFYWWGLTMCETLNIQPDDVLYNCLPLFHINALVAPVQALMAGATCEIGIRFSASQFWRNAANAGATITYLLGGLANILLSQPPRDSDTAHRVHTVLSPGLPPAAWNTFKERFGVAEIAESYGMTEVNHCIGRAPGHRTSEPGKIGYLLEPLFEARVVDDDDIEVPDDTPGQLILRSKYPFSFCTGYWRMPEATVELFKNLWVHTGDVVVRDSDGCYRFVDRQKDSIRRLGENISSWEVEQAILTYPGVSEAAVFPVKSEVGDEEVMAAVLPLPGCQIDPLALTRHLESCLAYFAIPRYIEIVSDLPRTENGKVVKAPLRNRGVTDSTWDRVAAGYELRRIR